LTDEEKDLIEEIRIIIKLSTGWEIAHLKNESTLWATSGYEVALKTLKEYLKI
jgi:hypothetical protein